MNAANNSAQKGCEGKMSQIPTKKVHNYDTHVIIQQCSAGIREIPPYMSGSSYRHVILLLPFGLHEHTFGASCLILIYSGFLLVQGTFRCAGIHAMATPHLQKVLLELGAAPLL